MKNILVAVDMDDRTNVLVDYAATLARKFGSKIWIVHIAAPDPDFVGYEAGPAYLRDFRAKELKEEHKQLQQVADALINEGIACEALLVQGPTVAMILDEAKKLDADLIIAGSHEHGFLYNAILGNTALSLFKKSRIAMLTVPV